MRKNAIIVIIVLISITLFCFFLLRDTREERLIKEGNAIIEKIEYYQQAHTRIPNSLEEIGIKEEDGWDVLYYDKRDSFHYTISFPISAEQHKFYYSDSKKWENGYREMKDLDKMMDKE